MAVTLAVPDGSGRRAARLADGATLPIDVPPAAAYDPRRVPGAVSAPVSDLAVRLGALPADRDLIAYCRGPHCTYACEAVGMLRADGRRARRLDGCFLAWRVCESEQRQRAAVCP